MSQRRIVVFDRVTADGYFAAEDGNLNWVVPDDAIDNAAVAGMPGTLISGVPKSQRLDLLEVKKYDSGNVVLRYAPKD